MMDHLESDRVSAGQILKKLREFANDPHDTICYGIVCRHMRALAAIEEVKNAIGEIEQERLLKL